MMLLIETSYFVDAVNLVYSLINFMISYRFLIEISLTDGFRLQKKKKISKFFQRSYKSKKVDKYQT